MKQKVQDVMLLLRRDRKVQVGLGVVLVFILFSLFAPDSAQRRQKPKAEAKTGAGQGGRSEVIDDVMVAVQQDLRNIRTQSQETATKLEEQIKRSADYEVKTAEIFKRILEQMADNRGSNDANAPTPGMPGYDANGNPIGDANGNGIPDYLEQGGAGGPNADGSYPAVSDIDQGPAVLDTVGFEDKAVAPPAPPARERVAFVGKGDSVRLKLLAGVRAPTDGTPYPVVFKMIGDVYGPDGSALPLGEARLVAAAQGSLVDSRVLYRLSSLNVRMPSGRHQVIDVDGWVVGEDGIRGMEGILIDPFGKAIGAAGFAGALSGFGRAVSSGQTTTQTNVFGGSQEVVTGDDATYAAGKALSGAADTYADLIRERLKLLVPHVEVLSGREATAVFSKSFTIKGLFDELNNEEDDGMGAMR